MTAATIVGKRHSRLHQRNMQEFSSDESWQNDSDHMDLLDDPQFKRMKSGADRKEERRAYKRKFLADREQARKKEVLRKFIDTQKVGLCVNNP